MNSRAAERIEALPIEQLIPYARNARTHSDAQVAQIAASIREFGFCNPVLIDGKGNIIAGHGRVLAGRQLGLKTIPCVRLDHLTDTQRRAYTIADNKLALNADWDMELLALELQELKALDFNLDLTGFDLSELASLDSEPVTEGDTEPQIDRAEELREQWGVETGQCWQLGDHRLLCGDSTKAEDVARVMQGEKADLLLTDPPYGMRLDTDFSSMESKIFKGKTGGAMYAPVIGDDRDYDPSFIFALWDAPEMFLWGADYYAERLPLKNNGSWLVWDKRLDDSADKMYGSCFELCWSKKAHKRDIIRVKWAGIFGMEKEDTQSRVHPTQKPNAVMAWICERYTGMGAIIADPYSGSGTTIIAAENLNRRCRAIEISPAYVAVALQRWADHTGQMPVLLP